MQAVNSTNYWFPFRSICDYFQSTSLRKCPKSKWSHVYLWKHQAISVWTGLAS